MSGLFYLKVEGEEFVPNYVKTMRFICITSMIAYVLFNAIPGLYEYLAQNSFENSGEWSSTRTIFIYQFSPINLITRNIGPFWEPGVFGIFINISIFFRLFILKEKLNRTFTRNYFSNINLFDYKLYNIICVVNFYYAYYSEQKIKFLYLVSIVALFVFVFIKSDFLNEKVMTQLGEAQFIVRNTEEGRFVSIIRDYDDIKSHG